MGLEIEYFYSLTPRQFYNIVKGYENKQNHALELLKVELFYKRQFTFQSIMIHADPKSTQNLTPEKMFPFAWEQTKQTNTELENRKPKTKEELQAIWDKVDKQKSNFDGEQRNHSN